MASGLGLKGSSRNAQPCRLASVCHLWTRALLLLALLPVGDGARADARERFGREVEPPEFVEDRADSLKLGISDVGNLRLVTSNAGTFGNRFDSRDNISMEWPARSGIDHLVRGGVWIGAINENNGDTLVTIGGRDAYYLELVTAHSEFSPIKPAPPDEFSRLPTSPFYRPGTIADEHLHTIYVDTLGVVKSGPEERHTPMGIRVIQNLYAWRLEGVDDFVIGEFNVVNVGDGSLADLWIGLFSQLVTNNRNYFAQWPPGGAWFDSQELEWNQEPRLLANHNTRGDRTAATQWAGIKVLGSGGSGALGRGPDSIATKQISLAAWSWTPSRFLTWTDDSLFVRMNTGRTEFPPGIPDPNNTEINPMTVLSVGPFPLLAPGDTVQVVFAFVAGENRTDLLDNAARAQMLYDEGYDMTSVPVEVQNLTATAVEGRVLLTWALALETRDGLAGIRVQRARDATGPFMDLHAHLLEPAAAMQFEDSDARGGQIDWYRLVLVESNGNRTIVGRPVPATWPVNSAAGAAIRVTSELGSTRSIEILYDVGGIATSVRLEVFDVMGRRVKLLEQGYRETGEHRTSWNRLDASGRRVAHGLYFVRLVAGRSKVSKTLVLLR